MQFDLLLFKAIFSLAHWSLILDWFGIFIATVFPFILGAGFVFAILKLTSDNRRRAYYFLFTVFALIISWGIVSNGFHYFYPRVRPFAALGVEPLFTPHSAGAFPSNHTVILFTLAFSLLFFSRAKREWLTASPDGSEAPRSQFHNWFFLGASLVALARIFSGVHYPLDVVGGILVAYAAVLVTNWLLPVTR